ncbi:adhesin [Actinoplanes sp. HUAS TT8]|uniref:adhesin n=1 Tax=Actinoplanes sp. HUAS TT8 TaxID=3447453 RepID=UPI003F527A03
MSMPALGPGNGDVAYRMQGLRHNPVELGLDESVPVWTLLRLWLSAAVPALVVWAVFAFLALFVRAVSEPNAFSENTPGDEVFAIGSLLSFIIFWVVLLSARVDESVAEWKALIEDRWQSADSAYAAIYGTLRRRGIPVEADAVRVRSDLLPPEVINNRLMITDRNYQIFISVFPYGSSLYLGWTMARGRRGVTLLGHFLRDLVGGMSGRGGSVDRMLRTERVRALREAVHSAVREGADVAAQGLLVPAGAVFGAEVPVRDLRARVAPAYAPHPGPHPGAGPAQHNAMPSQSGPMPVPSGPVSAPPGPVSAMPAPGPMPGYAAPDSYAPPQQSTTPPEAQAEQPKPRPHPHPSPSEGTDPPIS